MKLEEYEMRRPGNPERQEELKKEILASVRAYRLQELRKSAGFSQAELAEKIGVSQRQVSKIESGNLENSKVSTIRRYVEALGGKLAVNFVGSESVLFLT